LCPDFWDAKKLGVKNLGRGGGGRAAFSEHCCTSDNESDINLQ